MNRLKTLLLLGLTSFVLSACVSTQAPPELQLPELKPPPISVPSTPFLTGSGQVLQTTATPTPPVNASSTGNKAPETRSYTGRCTVTYPTDGETGREQGSFEWRVGLGLGLDSTRGDNTALAPMQLLLNTPLGNTVAVLAHSPSAPAAQRFSLKTPSFTDTADSFDALMQRHLGWQLPLAAVMGLITQPTGNETAQSSTPNSDWGLAVVSRYDSQQVKVLNVQNTARGITARLVFEELGATPY